MSGVLLIFLVLILGCDRSKKKPLLLSALKKVLRNLFLRRMYAAWNGSPFIAFPEVLMVQLLWMNMHSLARTSCLQSSSQTVS